METALNMALLTMEQTLMMFLLIGLGFLLFKIKFITVEGSGSIMKLLVYAVLPTVIVKSFFAERTVESMQNLGISALVAAGAVFINIVVSTIACRKNSLDVVAAAFSNCGFFGLPLIAADLGEGAKFFVVAYIVLNNFFQWTYGISRIKGEPFKESLKPKPLLLSPVFVAAVIGMIIYFSGLGGMMNDVPVVSDTVNAVASMNTTLAMIIMGVYLGQTDFKSLFTTASVYFTSFVRLILCPSLTFLMMWFLPVDINIKIAILIVAACPVGTNVAAYAQLCGKDYAYGVKTVLMSTLFAMITLPLLIMLGNILWI